MNERKGRVTGNPNVQPKRRGYSKAAGYPGKNGMVNIFKSHIAYLEDTSIHQNLVFHLAVVHQFTISFHHPQWFRSTVNPLSLSSWYHTRMI
jgi:hypothetical protein